jgi:hypothetical protein
MASPFARLTFPVALVLLAGVTVGGIALAFALREGSFSWLVIPPVAVLAGLFLRDYHHRPMMELTAAAGTQLSEEGPAPPTAAGASTSGGTRAEEDNEPFVDPVEEADRADRTQAATPEIDPPPPEGGSPDDVDEPFVDPVEEADRADRPAEPTSPGASERAA